MADINRVIISGRLTRDPEVRATAGGTTVLGFGVAVNDRRRNQQTGQWEDYANYIDCSMFGNRAEALSKILTKGMLVCCEGRLRWSSWERDGQKRSKIEVIVDEVVLPSRSQGGAGGYQAGQYQQGGYVPNSSSSSAVGGDYEQTPAPSQGEPAQQPPMDQTYDDEIPF
jgi:single-strand DNA-binding protein